MIGRIEVTEILGMAGTCALLLFAGFAVETLEGNVEPSWAMTTEVSAPYVPDEVRLPDELRLELLHLERPLHPVPPPVFVEPLDDSAASACACRKMGS